MQNTGSDLRFRLRARVADCTPGDHTRGLFEHVRNRTTLERPQELETKWT